MTPGLQRDLDQQFWERAALAIATLDPGTCATHQDWADQCALMADALLLERNKRFSLEPAPAEVLDKIGSKIREEAVAPGTHQFQIDPNSLNCAFCGRKPFSKIHETRPRP